MGALTNIDQEGFASVAFHSFPSRLRWDTYTGDYGPNFFGHAVTTGTYVVNHPDYGWQAFGGNLTNAGGWVTVKVLDSLRRRIYIAPLGLYLTLDAGTLDSVAIHQTRKAVRITLSPATPFTRNARLRIEQPAQIAGVGTYSMAAGTFTTERGAIVVPLEATATMIEVGQR